MVHQWLHVQPKIFFHVIKDFVGHWEKCVKELGGYAEK
jgi:hypothetical protein